MCFKEFDEKCDVYSFGIVLWEIYTREEPFAEYQAFDKFKEAICVRHERPRIPDDCVSSLRTLMTACWHPDPPQRPPFSTIIYALDRVIVDCAIADPRGREFWGTYFSRKEEVPWNEFAEALSEYLDLPADDNEFNLKCLQALLAENANSVTAENVSIEKFGKILSWFGPMDEDLPEDAMDVDTLATRETFLDRIKNMLLKTWFHGDVSTSEAQIKLSGQAGGTFLVRFSSTTPGSFTISSLTQSNSSIRHQRVSYIAGKGFNYNGQYRRTLDEIISEEENLLIPCPGSKFAALIDQPNAVIGYT